MDTDLDTLNQPTTETTTESVTPPDLGHASDQIWLVLAATIVAASVQALRASGALKSLPKRWIPVLGTVLSVVGAVSASIASGAPVEDGITQGLLVGLSATGFYEVSKPKKKPQTTPAA